MTTVAEFAVGVFLPEVQRSKSPVTYSTYRTLLTLHVFPAIGDLRCGEVTEEHIGQWSTRLDRSGLADKSVVNVRSVVASLLAAAHEAGVVSHRLALPAAAHTRRRVRKRPGPRSAVPLEVSTLGQMIEAYVRERAARGDLSDESVAVTRTVLRFFARYAGHEIAGCTPDVVAMWLADSDLAPNTVKSYLARVRGFAARRVRRRLRPSHARFGQTFAQHF